MLWSPLAFAGGAGAFIGRLAGWWAHAQGQRGRGVEIMREAAELEVATPKHAVTPGPTVPAFELPGDLYIEQKQPTEALAAYLLKQAREYVSKQ